eukprot:11391690-Heterocapsa_arctica.AAC.1
MPVLQRLDRFRDLLHLGLQGLHELHQLVGEGLLAHLLLHAAHVPVTAHELLVAKGHARHALLDVRERRPEWLQNRLVVGPAPRLHTGDGVLELCCLARAAFVVRLQRACVAAGDSKG